MVVDFIIMGMVGIAVLIYAILALVWFTPLGDYLINGSDKDEHDSY